LKKKRVVNYVIKSKANIDIANIHILLKEGFEKYKLKSGYANVAPVGAYIKRKIPDFNVHEYGFSKLSELIENHPNMYVLERDNSKEVPIVLYKCL